MNRDKFDEACIKLFKGLVPLKDAPEEVNRLATDEYFLFQGIVVDPILKSTLTEKSIANITWYHGRDAFNLNQTFHKSLEEVSEISPEEHYFKQFLHYMTTYGFEALGIEGDYVYIPNEKLELPLDTVPIKPILIKALSEDEVKVRVTNMLAAGIAMKSETINAILDIMDYLDFDVILDQVKNKEARCAIAYKRNIAVKTSDDALRVLRYAIFGDAMVVRSFRDMHKLKEVVKIDQWLDIVYNYIKVLPVRVIADKFNKNRNMWFGFRTELTGDEEKDEKIKYIRNKINLASRWNKKRIKIPEKEIPTLDNFSSYLNTNPGAALYEYSVNDFEVINKEENLFRLVKFINYLREKIRNPEHKIYRVRNGRTYVADNESLLRTDVAVTCQELMNVTKQRIMTLLLERIGDKKVYIPSNLEYGVPTSEKQFIRGIPEGSRYKFKDNALIAIHWNNVKDGDREIRVDLDLKGYSDTQVIGWDSDFRTDKCTVMFSGDVTDAPIEKGGASEVLFFDKDVFDVFGIMVNNYTNSVDTPFEIIFEDTDKDKSNNFRGGSREERCNHIIDNTTANKLITVAKTKESSQMTIGLYMNKSFWFTDTCIGFGKTAVKSDYLDNYLLGIKDKFESRITLNELFKDLGILVENPQEADIDLSLENITADTFIDLFVDKGDIV